MSFTREHSIQPRFLGKRRSTDLRQSRDGALDNDDVRLQRQNLGDLNLNVLRLLHESQVESTTA